MRAAVAAWVGSANAGDELVHAGLRRHLADLGVEPVVGGRARLVAGAALGRVDALVLGGGGLLQDETSDLNLPYHLAPVLAARVPAAGVGLGAGPLVTRAGRALVRRALARLAAVAVRDRSSAELLARIGARRPAVAADLAFRLPRPDVEAADVLAVALRPWTGRRHRLPVALRRSAAAVNEAFAARAAAALDAAAARTGLAVELVALDPPKDEPLARAVAARMRRPAAVLAPPPLDVPAVLARGRVVVAMRYHGGVCAALARRPAVLLGYSAKVPDLAGDLEAPLLPWELPDPGELAAAVEAALARPPDRLEELVAALVAREAGNRRVLEQVIDR